MRVGYMQIYAIHHELVDECNFADVCTPPAA
jgi:hypothetical protein